MMSEEEEEEDEGVGGGVTLTMRKSSLWFSGLVSEESVLESGTSDPHQPEHK